MSFNKIFKLFAISIFLISISYSQEKGYELNSINFTGNNEFSSSELRYNIYSEESPGWVWKFLNSFTPFGRGPVYFDSTEIPSDVNALRAFYNAHGFFKSEVSYKYSVDTTDKSVDLTYIIKENKPSTYGSLYIFGVDTLPLSVRQFISQQLNVDTTKRYDENTLQQKVEGALNVLLNSGYMFARFDSTLIIKDTTINKADINVYYTPGKRYKIDSLVIRKDGAGAPEVSDDLLRKLTDIKKGEYYDLDAIKQKQTMLFRTNLFNSVVLSPVERDTTDSKVPLRLSGNIGLLNELSPELILNNQNNALNIGLSASYVRKNFLGEARTLTISPSFGIQDFYNIDYARLFKKFSIYDTTLLGYVDAHITIQQPYLFGKPIFGTWENYAQILKQSNYNIITYGSKLNFEFELPSYTIINFLSTYFSVEEDKERYFTIDSSSSKLPSYLGANFGRTYVDNLLFPTTGYNISMEAEIANIFPYIFAKTFKTDFSDALFYRLVFTGSFYIPLNIRRNTIFAFKTKIGNIHTFVGDYGDIPLNRTFRPGGSNSVRGWRTNQLHPPQAPSITNYVEGITDIKGGTFLLESSMELRYRFVESFGTVLFADCGNSWIGYQTFRFDQLAVAAGIGFRYYSQIAPFRVDFGFKVYDPYDKTTILKKPFWKQMEFHFGIGEAF
jgi:outer membrane protein insertion porin family